MSSNPALSRQVENVIAASFVPARDSAPEALTRLGASAEENAARLIGSALGGRPEAVEAVQELDPPCALGDVPFRVLTAIKALAERGKPIAAETVFQECGGDPQVAIYLSEAIFKPACFPQECAAVVAEFGRELERQSIAESIAGRVRAGVPADDLAARLLELGRGADCDTLTPCRLMDAGPVPDPLFTNGPAPGVFALLCGDSSIGKTFALLSMAISLSTGHTIWPRFAPAKKLKVALFASEDPPEVLKVRALAVARASHVPESDLVAALHSGQLSIFSDGDLPGPLFVSGEEYGPPEKTPTYAKLRAWVLRNRPDLVILDPLISVARVREDNESFNWLAQELKALAADTGATLLLSHHTSKASARSGEVSQHAMRGPSSLTGAARWAGLIVQSEKRLLFAVEKNAYGQKTAFDLERNSEGVLLQVDRAQVMEGDARELADWLLENSAAGLTVRMLTKGEGAGRECLAALDWTRTYAADVLKFALGAGLVTVEHRPRTKGGAAVEYLKAQAAGGYSHDDCPF